MLAATAAKYIIWFGRNKWMEKNQGMFKLRLEKVSGAINLKIKKKFYIGENYVLEKKEDYIFYFNSTIEI